MVIQGYPEELDYVNARLHTTDLTVQHIAAVAEAYAKAGGGKLQLAVIEPEVGSFLEYFLRACLAADFFNYELLRPTLEILMHRYPADPRRLAIERHDRGADRPGDEALISR